MSVFLAVGIAPEKKAGNTCITCRIKVTFHFRLSAFQLSRLFMKH